jgi:hypothetical protein
MRTPVARVAYAHTGNTAVVAEHLVEDVVPGDADILILALFDQLIGENFLGAKLIAPVHHGDMGCDIGKIERFFYSGITAADDRHRLISVEETVAGRTGGYTAALESFLGVEPQVSGRGTGGNDECVAGVDGSITGEAKGPRVEIRLPDGVEYHLGLEALGVLAHALHELRALQTTDVTRPVVHIRGGRHLSTHLEAGNQHRAQVGTSRIDGRRVAGGAGSENQQSAVFDIGHEDLLKFSGSFARQHAQGLHVG